MSVFSKRFSASVFRVSLTAKAVAQVIFPVMPKHGARAMGFPRITDLDGDGLFLPVDEIAGGDLCNIMRPLTVAMVQRLSRIHSFLSLKIKQFSPRIFSTSSVSES